MLAAFCCTAANPLPAGTSLPVVGISVGHMQDAIIGTALANHRFRVWGKVSSTNGAAFFISDGSSPPLQITSPANSLIVGTYVTATGTIVDGSPRTMICDPADISVVDESGGTQIHPGLVYVAAGSFLMGNNGSEPYSYSNELPQHSVFVFGYYIGKYEVTRGEYRQFITAGGYSNSAYWSADGWSFVTSYHRTEPDYWAAVQNWGGNSFTQTDSHPVVGVSYYEGEAYCNWAGGHLPTEAQWEKAARWYGTPRIYPWSSTWDAEVCNNYYDHSAAGGGYQARQTAPVGSYPLGAGPYGCQDMAGNVWEWCKDWYSSSYYSQTPAGGWSDPQGPSSGSYRVWRGGSWYDGEDGYDTRCAYRSYGSPSTRYGSVGFRMAR